jgi:hypothetical protein
MAAAILTRSRTGRLVGLAAMVLHLGATAVTPLVHAKHEVLQSELKIESNHTAQCPRIHSDRLCLSTSGYQLPSGPVRTLLEGPPAERRSDPAPGPESFSRYEGFSRLSARAPPAA